MTRRMRDKDFRDDQWARRYTGKVERINRFIDEFGAKDDAGHPPYIPPMCGGVDALALSISRDPGPKAGGTQGSGFLSIENDDPSAERMGQFFDEAGIDYAEVVPWNAYPWYINSDPTTDQLLAGVEPLRDLIGLMPRLRVVLVHGTAADKGWKLFLRENRNLFCAPAQLFDIGRRWRPDRAVLAPLLAVAHLMAHRQVRAVPDDGGCVFRQGWLAGLDRDAGRVPVVEAPSCRRGLTGWPNGRTTGFSRPEGPGGFAAGNRLDTLGRQVLTGVCGQEISDHRSPADAVWMAGLPGQDEAAASQVSGLQGG